MLTTFCRQRGNGTIDVSHESRTTRMSALFHIFTCAFGRGQRQEARKIFLRNPRVLLSHIFTLVTLYISIFTEIPLTPASPPERNDGQGLTTGSPLSYSSRWLITVSFSYERALFWNFLQINQRTYKLPYTGRSVKYYTVPVISCVVLGRFEGFWFCRRLPINQNFYCKVVGGRTKIPQNAQRKKPQVQCNTLLICLCREVWRSFVGNFRTALSHKRNWPWSTTVTDMKAYTKGGAACGLTCTLGLPDLIDNRELNLIYVKRS